MITDWSGANLFELLRFVNNGFLSTAGAYGLLNLGCSGIGGFLVTIDGLTIGGVPTAWAV